MGNIFKNLHIGKNYKVLVYSVRVPKKLQVMSLSVSPSGLYHAHCVFPSFSDGRWELVKQKFVILYDTSGVSWHSFVSYYGVGNFSTMVFAKSRWCLKRIEPNRISVRNEFSNGSRVPAWLMNPTLAEWKTPFTIRPSIDECRGKSIHT